MQDLRGLAQQADLRVLGMDVEELGHGVIVSAPWRPCHDNAYSRRRYSGSTSTAAVGVEAPGRRMFSAADAAPHAAITAMPTQAQ